MWISSIDEIISVNMDWKFHTVDVFANIDRDKKIDKLDSYTLQIAIKNACQDIVSASLGVPERGSHVHFAGLNDDDVCAGDAAIHVHRNPIPRLTCLSIVTREENSIHSSIVEFHVDFFLYAGVGRIGAPGAELFRANVPGPCYSESTD